MYSEKINDLSFYNDQGILTLSAKQFDTGRKFTFRIIDNDEIFDLNNCRVYLRVLKADKTQFQGEDCCIISNNLITIDTSVSNGNQILTCEGLNSCELHLTDENGKSLTTWTFIINVVPRVHDGNSLDSKDTWDLWDNIRDTFLKLKDTLTNILNNHINDTDNPHDVTKKQIGLENVPNVSTNDQTPDFDEATERENIVSGEKLSIILGKIKKCISEIKEIAFSGSYNDLEDKPNLKTVATSGSYNDLEDKPTMTSLNRHRITTLTNISQINEIGFWNISAIDSSYATQIGIEENVGDFHVICCSYNGNGDRYYFGSLLLFSPRLGTKYYYINVWEGVANATKSIVKYNLLNTIEQISANTSTDNVCSALALKAAMADYTNKFNQINSDLLTFKSANLLKGVCDATNENLTNFGKCYKCGNFVIVKAYFASMYFTSNATMFVVPESFRPKSMVEGIIHCQRLTGGQEVNTNICIVSASGNISQQFNNDGTSTIWRGDFFALYKL